MIINSKLNWDQDSLDFYTTWLEKINDKLLILVDVAEQIARENLESKKGQS